MKGLLAVLTPLLPIMMVVNFFGGIVGCVWVAATGDWWAIGYAFLGLLAHFLLAILLAPTLAIAGLGMRAVERRRFVQARLWITARNTYVSILMLVWVAFATGLFM